MRKKILVLLLVCMLAVFSVFVGCGKKDKAGTAAGGNGTVPGLLPGVGQQGDVPGITETPVTPEPPKESHYREDIKELAKASTVRCEPYKDIVQLGAKVSMPPLTDLMLSISAELDKGNISLEDFEDELLSRVLVESKKEDVKLKTYNITVDLTAIDPSKSAEDWTQQELEKIAIDEVFDKALNDFCMNIINQNAPAFPAEEVSE